MGIFRLCLRDSERPSWCSGRQSKGRWWWLLMRTHVGAGLWASSNAGVRLKEPCLFLPLDSSQFSSIQWLSCVRLFQTPWTAARQASLSITNSQSLLKLIFIESVMPSNHLIFCCPPLLLPTLFPSIRVFSNESVLHIRWPKYWSFSFNISPYNEHSGLISFRKDWQNVVYWRREMHPNSTSNPSFCLHWNPIPAWLPNPYYRHSSFDLGLDKPLSQPFNQKRHHFPLRKALLFHSGAVPRWKALQPL